VLKVSTNLINKDIAFFFKMLLFYQQYSKLHLISLICVIHGSILEIKDLKTKFLDFLPRHFLRMERQKMEI